MNNYWRFLCKSFSVISLFAFLPTSIVQAQIVDQLTAYWTFDNTLVDSAGDFSGSANTSDDELAFQGSGSGYGTGFLGSAGYSGNGDGYAEVADTADVDEGNGTISISLWVRVEDFNTAFQTVISKGESENYRISRRQSTSTASFAGGNPDIFTDPIAINDGNWYHLAATAGPSGSHFYLNGTLVSSDNSAAELLNTNNPLFIGNNPERTNRRWDGEIDDVALWHRELSLEEIESIYSAGSNGISLGNLILSGNTIVRLQAEDFDFSGGFFADNVTGADGGRVARLALNGDAGVATMSLDAIALGSNNLTLVVFDESDGVSSITVELERAGGEVETIDTVLLNQDGGGSGTQLSNLRSIVFNDVDIQAGDTLRLDVESDSGEAARIDYVEFISTEPPSSDVDNDGLNDAWELSFGLSISIATGALGNNGADGDPDGDLLSNLEEFNSGTNPIVADTDQDGINDGSEVSTHNTDPLLVDTDGDGSSDGEEIFFSTNPNNAQSTPTAQQTTSGVATVASIGPYLDGRLPQIAPSANQNAEENWIVENAFPNLSFSSLKGLVAEPQSSHLYIIERRGTIQRIDASNPNTNSRQQVLDISSMIVNGDNGGLRSVVFHPEFNDPNSSNRNFIYCFYSTTAETSHGFNTNDGQFFYRLSRFTRNEANGTYPTSSELVLIQHASRDTGQHFGGSLGFDQDGFLIIGWGDMEFRDSRVVVDFYQDVQRIDRIFQGAVLRIDVDNRGGSISHAPVRTLQGASGLYGVSGTSQSCLPSHPYYHSENISGRDYMIPSDNYFVTNPPTAGSGAFADTPLHGPALQEHQALGTRNPWRMAVDPVDGHIAFFNVGSNQGEDFEEVELLSPGANWGWPFLEGETSQTSETNRSRPPSQYAPVRLGNETLPVAYWAHNAGRVASGGVFYRGFQWPQIGAQLVFADQNSGRIWALDYKNAGAPSSNYSTNDLVSTPSNYSVRELVDSNVQVRQMAAGPAGQEVYMAGPNQIFRLVNSATFNPEPPALLSQTGAFTNLANLTPAAGLIPFEPASELWSDRAAKKRWIAIPNTSGVAGQYDQPEEKITYSENGEWAFPIGSVFIKHFSLPSDLRDPDNPASLTPLETRFGVRGADGEYFYFTYRWRANGTDADLISDSESVGFPITNLDGSSGTQVWEYPSRQQCFECHQDNSGSVLGIKTRQLNHPILYPSTGTTANQLTTFSNLGLFDQGPDFSALGSTLTSAGITDSSESWEHRVRSYLDSNCSYCHRPEAEAGRADFDGLLSTPLNLANLINAPVQADDLGVPNAQVVQPGRPDESVLYLRDSSTDTEVRMPPVGRTLIDPDYLPILKAWIETIGLDGYIAWARSLNIDSGLSSDEDGDGFLNVFEYVFQQNGATPDTLPTEINSGSYSIPVSGDSLADGLQVSIEGSANSTDWFPISDSQSQLSVASNSSAPNVDGTLNLTVTSTASEHFIRYGVINSNAPGGGLIASYIVRVNNVNSLPVAQAVSSAVLEDQSISIGLVGNDADGDSLTYSISTQPTNGALSGSLPNITYTPAANYSGLDSFAFIVNDGTANSLPATVSITVSPVNDPPLASSTSLTVLEDASTNVTLQGSDADGNSLSYTITTNPSNGTVTGTAPNLVYTPAANYHGEDSFAYRVNDGTTNSNTAAITITVNSVNDAPIASNFSTSVLEGDSVELTLVGDDADGTELTFSYQQPSNGTITGSGAQVTYTPDPGYSGEDQFTYTANDGTLDSSPATVSISVQEIVLSGYEAYLAGFPGLTATGFDDDPDGDGVSNGFEYVFGSNPLVNDNSQLRSFSVTETNTVITFNRNPNSLVDTIQVFEYSADLKVWTALSLQDPISSGVSIGESVDGRQPISVTVDGITDKLFWRLDVQRRQEE